MRFAHKGWAGAYDARQRSTSITSKLLVKTLAAALLAVPVLASAQQAFTSQYVNMRAGPAADYPVVTTLPQGTSLMVQGCVNDFTWCDVQLPDSGRG